MPTTRGELARACLAGLTEAGVEFAVLHGYEHLETDRISDIDIVVGQDPRAVVKAAREYWREAGLTPIILWPYDIGATAAVFLTTREARDGVQLDMLHDPDGIGRYGVRSDVLLRFVEKRPLAPVVDEGARLLYLWQKRTAKGETDRLDALRGETIGIEAKRLKSMSREITGSENAARGLIGRQPVSEPRRTPALPARLSRIVSRLRHPSGAWVHVTSDEVGNELARRLSRHLVTARCETLPSYLRQVPWYLLEVAPIRFRPGVYVSVGLRPRFVVKPDFEIVADDIEQAAAALVEALTTRTMACVS